MNEVRKFLGALRNLKEDFGMNGGGFIEYATRMGALIELADEERRPVADKALSLWLSRGVQLRNWLMDQPADVILQAYGPCAHLDLANLFIEGFGRFVRNPQSCGAVKVGIVGFGEGYALEHYSHGVAVVARFKLREECADRAQKAWDKYGDEASQEWLREQSADFIATSSDQEFDTCLALAAVVKAVRKVFGPKEWFRPGPVISEAIYPLREECADAAQWLVMNGIRMGSGENFSAGEWLCMSGGKGQAHSPEWIISSARERLDEFNAKRQQVAVECMKDAIAISNGLSRPKASDRVRKIAELLLEEVAANESR